MQFGRILTNCRCQLFAATLLPFWLAGCGDGRIKTYPVRGQITVDGNPAAGVRVYFDPLEGSDEFRAQRPAATTDEAGYFTLTTFERGDGAPAGEYAVLAKWRKQTSAPAGEDQDEERGQRLVSRDVLRGKYATAKVSDLRATIVAGDNELEPYELTTK